MTVQPGRVLCGVSWPSHNVGVLFLRSRAEVCSNIVLSAHRKDIHADGDVGLQREIGGGGGGRKKIKRKILFFFFFTGIRKGQLNFPK